MRDTERTFVLAGLVVFFLLAMHGLPHMTVNGKELRRVNILSDLLPEPDGNEASVIPTPKPPKPVEVVKDKSGKAIDFKEIWPKGVQPIVDYSSGEAGGMDCFYASLSQVESINRPVRIAFFGDSFVENDIMTADLREAFQYDFGGTGVGWIDLANPSNHNSRRTVTQETSGIKEFSPLAKPFDKQRQGINCKYYSLQPGAKVLTNVSSVFNRYQPHSKSFEVARLFFRTNGGVQIKATIDNQPPRTQSFGTSSSVQMFEVKGKGKQIAYAFNGLQGQFSGYGMALESNKGVILDCISMRGSNGLPINNIPLQTLKDFNRLRPYDLIIVQYGLNVAGDGNPQSVIKGYARNMQKVISHLRQAFPKSSILVMSVPDREQRTADGIRTLKEVKWLVAYQQQLAADCHVAWYNLFEAMGGEGATRKLVERNLANKDYTHLSYGGGKEVALKIYPSFKAGFNNYLRRKKLEQE